MCLAFLGDLNTKYHSPSRPGDFSLLKRQKKLAALTSHMGLPLTLGKLGTREGPVPRGVTPAGCREAAVPVPLSTSPGSEPSSQPQSPTRLSYDVGVGWGGVQAEVRQG